MTLVEEFKAKKFNEQIDFLVKVGRDKKIEYLPELFFLYDLLTGDKTVDAMVEHTLRDILSENEAETVKRLCDGTWKEKKLSLHIAGEKRFGAAVIPIIDLLEKEKDAGVLTEAYIAMSEIRHPHFLDTFRNSICHQEELIAGISVEMLGAYNDMDSLEALQQMIDKCEEDGQYEICRLRTAKAIETIAVLANENDCDECRRYLVSKIHHRNPTARRLVQDELVKMGERVLPILKAAIPKQDEDQRIMTANTIGGIGARKGARILVDALDKGLFKTPNTRAAAYEALGYARSLKGLVCLVDALTEEDPLVLMTVVTALDLQVNPTVVERIKAITVPGNPHAESLLQAIINCEALNIFQQLYLWDSEKEKLIKTLLECNNPSIQELFAHTLERMEDENAGTAAAQILAKAKAAMQAQHACRILAVDDSKSVRLFYNSVIAGMSGDAKMSGGMETRFESTVAENGKEAWDILRYGKKFDLIITDMNMPVMDGIEFTRKVRSENCYDDIPIIMGTTESENSQTELARDSGVNYFFTKPIKASLLMERIKGALPK